MIWSVLLQCSSRSHAVPTRDRDDDDGVTLGSSSTRGLRSSSHDLLLGPLLSVRCGCWATKRRRWLRERLRLQAWLYSRAPCLQWRSASCGGRHGMHPMVARGCVSAAQGEQGHASGVTPWPAPASAVGLRSRGQLRRGRRR